MDLPDWIRFERLALATTASTGLLMTLGVYTAATGAGLACAQQWPLCDGGLLPQSIPSFVEWLHRFVAMLVGFLIIGTAGWSWLGDRARRTSIAATVAVVLLPLQVSIGAVTVTLNGALPQGYSTPTQAAHLLAALSIFTALTLATLFARDEGGPPGEGGATAASVETAGWADGERPRVRLGLLAALGALPLAALFGRTTTLFAYTPPAQAAFVASGLVAFAGLLAAAGWAIDRRLRAAAAVALACTLLVLLLGRDLVLYDSTARALNWAAIVGGVAAAAVGARAADAAGAVREAVPTRE